MIYCNMAHLRRLYILFNNFHTKTDKISCTPSISQLVNLPSYISCLDLNFSRKVGLAKVLLNKEFVMDKNIIRAEIGLRPGV